MDCDVEQVPRNRTTDLDLSQHPGRILSQHKYPNFIARLTLMTDRMAAQPQVGSENLLSVPISLKGRAGEPKVSDHPNMPQTSTDFRTT
jgi:hypothetical protein